MAEILKGHKMPYICTPLTGRNKKEILGELEAVLPENPDLIEWRADFLDKLDDLPYVLSVLDEIAAKSGLPVLFTIRSIHEGGEPITLSESQKVKLLCDVCKSGAVSLIDYEVSNDPGHITELRNVSQENEKKLILSYHNFDYTPSNEAVMKKLFLAEFYGADMAKAAVMPKNNDDVLRLLQITNDADRSLNIPLITMSMGNIGVISRIIGWAYGSYITFGSGVRGSAPGQVPISKLKKMITMIKEERDKS